VNKVVLALAATLVAGCVTVVDRTALEDPSATWRSRQSQLLLINTWDIQGRVSARSLNEGWQASIRWARDKQRHEIDLWGPLGRGHVRLTLDDSGAQLRDTDQSTYRADDAQQLLFETTGWWLPLDGLNYWILGVPVPDTPNQHVLDESGRLMTLKQLGWNIRFMRYRRFGRFEFPRKLFIQRETASNLTLESREYEREVPILEVRLVVQKWMVEP
jgi:outer membrane lipoprotein LolB